MLLAALLAVQAVPPIPTAPVPEFVCPGGARVPAADSCPGLIFFDSGGTEIRREWDPVLDAAVAGARSGQRLTVTGHSDAPGSRAVNRRMARSRAEAVVSALVARGVPASAITIAAAGEEQLMVPTAEGVREIHNRRVEIALQP